MIDESLLEFSTIMKEHCVKNDAISDVLFKEYGVNRGLRDVNGKGVLTGLTNISKIIPFDGEGGQLWYRGYTIKDLIEKIGKNGYGFEKAAFLLMFGELPDDEEYQKFLEIVSRCRRLPTNFTRDIIMKAASEDIMTSMMRGILALASYDSQAKMTDVSNVIGQSIYLMSVFPMLAVYSYHAYNHYTNGASMYIHRPQSDLSLTENLLYMLRPDNKYSELEARALDIALILHMEHGGGNNSTFTTRVVTSSGSDTYATISAAMASLKGPKHGGANIKVVEMMKDIEQNISDKNDDKEIKTYLGQILDKQAFDKQGLIYGMGHAIYSVSDPREQLLKQYAIALANEKNVTDELSLYQKVEELAPQVIAEKRKIYKGVSPNVDFYSGFVYKMLDIPVELYTPLFAIARIVGWGAHRIEEIIGSGKIIRPAYMSVMEEKENS